MTTLPFPIPARINIVGVPTVFAIIIGVLKTKILPGIVPGRVLSVTSKQSRRDTTRTVRATAAATIDHRKGAEHDTRRNDHRSRNSRTPCFFVLAGTPPPPPPPP